MTPLNEGQKKAAEDVLKFLLGNQKEMCISGPGGSGKTHLMGNIVDSVIPQAQDLGKILGQETIVDTVAITATTNKAAEVLGDAVGRPAETIQSKMGLVVKQDYQTGNTRLSRKGGWSPLHKTVLFVDEAYTMDSQLRDHIVDGTINCKIIYVGDHCQLGPIKETLSPIHTSGLPTSYLTESMRNRNSPELQAICAQLRNTVETGVFEPIKEVPGVIDFLDTEQYQKELATFFTDPEKEDARIIAYHNEQVISYADYLRDLRGMSPQFQAGEKLINNNLLSINKNQISVEAEVTLSQIDNFVSKYPVTDSVDIDVRYATLISRWTVMHKVPIPVDPGHVKQMLLWLKRQKMWSTYFRLKESIPDLRMKEASTVHKSQGSTYETVFIDLANISLCPNPLTAARLLYVAFTRASKRVVCYGNLAPKYGGLIHAKE